MLSSTFPKNRVLTSLIVCPPRNIREAASRTHRDVVFMKHPLGQLASRSIHSFVGEGAATLPVDSLARTVEIEDMVAKYSVGLGAAVGGREGFPWKPGHGHGILLTGSTGMLGSYMLASLLGREDVAVVYAFNRPSEANTIQIRQRAAFEDYGLDASILDSEKLIFVEGNAAQANLSLDDRTYAEFRDSVTVIIHNAWRLHLNLPLVSFEPNVRGTKRLIDLARVSKHSARFLFTSSITSAQGWDRAEGAFPEEVDFDAGIAVGHGYGASKYVSERIVAASGLSATSFRIGQVTGGAPRGAWSTTQWVPMIVRSSVTLGAFPDARGVVSWLPPHAVSGAILDVAFAEEEPPVVVNLVHPRPIAWTSLIQPIRDAVYQRHLTSSPLPLIPFSEWVARLNACAMDARGVNIRRVPAIKLIHFMRSLADGDEALRRREYGALSGRWTGEALGFGSLATDVAQRVSGTMRALEPLSAVDAVQWVDYWVSVGMLSDGVEVQSVQ